MDSTTKVGIAGTLHTRAAIVPSSFNAEQRTVEVTWTTGARGLRRSLRGSYYEELEVSEQACDLSRLNNGAPLLAAHDGFELGAVLGVVERAWIDKGIGHATVRFSKRTEVEPVLSDVRDGILRHISVGYDVQKYEEVGQHEDVPVYRATRWQPAEISFVPMGFDDAAVVRALSDPSLAVDVPVIRKERSMPEATPAVVTPPKVRGECNCDELDPSDDSEAWEECECDDAERAHAGESKGDRIARMKRNAEKCKARKAARVAKAASGGGSPAPAAAVVTPPAIDPVKAERDRVVEIQRMVRAHRLPDELAQRLITDVVLIADARKVVIDELEKRDIAMHGQRETHGQVEAGTDGGDKVLRGVANALLHRINPGANALEAGNPFRGMRLLETARYFFEARGIRTAGWGPLELASAALGLTARAVSHTISDYPSVLADVANKSLRQAYMEAPQTFGPISRRVSLNDFKNRNVVQLGEAPTLDKVLEGAEFTRGTIGNGKETYALSTYGKVFAITRQALINDDLDAFSRVPMLFGRSARNLESDLAWKQITSNPTMATDSVALFHATHSNLTGSGTVISVTSMGVARSAMRKQKGLDGVMRMNLQPKYLIVPTALETVADQLVSTALLAQQTSNVNVFSGRLTVITEPRLDDDSATAWYVAADPGQIDIIECGYLDGQDGPFVETRIGFEVDGLEIKARHDFAAKVLDFRGLYKNPGA